MLGLRFDRLVHAALAGGGLTLSACPGGGQDTDTDTDTDGTSGTDGGDPTTDEPTTGSPPPPPPPPPPPDTTPPALVAVEFIDPQLLLLSFTEAIAPVDNVNPKRFRLSVGRFYENTYYGYSRTLYSDPDEFNRDIYCPEECNDGYCYEQCYYGPPLELDILDLLADAYDPAKVVLLLEQPATPNLCQIVISISSGGLLLHYADGGASQITDTAGLPLPATGATWVKLANTSYYTLDDQNFPEQTPFLPIPCPF